MSVSFYPEVVSGKSVIVCGCEGWRSAEFATYGQASAAMLEQVVVSGCSDEFCQTYPDLFIISAEVSPEVNVSNINAETVLDNLGIMVGEDFSERCAGSMSAADFKGRVLMALALVPVDEGMPAYQLTEAPESGAGSSLARLGLGAERGPQFFMGARPAGQAQTTLRQLLEVAEFATAAAREVVWS
jgi:hypothetical protein